MGERLKQVILEAIDDGLLILGDSSRKAIYFHVQSIVSVSRENIPDNLEAFTKGLEKIFGAGSKVIERAIAKSLCQKLGVQFEENRFKGLADCINEITAGRVKENVAEY